MPLSAFAEFADLVGTGPAATPPPFSSGGTAALPVEEILARDYDLDLGNCISRGWKLLQENFGLLFCGLLIYAGVEFAIALFGMIPIIGTLFSLANIFIVGPLLGGLYYVNLQAIRRQPANAGDVFAGFRTNFLQLFLGNLIPGLLAALCMIPAGIVALLTILPASIRHEQPGPAALVFLFGVALVCVIPAVFLQINWVFTLPLIIDRKMNFWPAMQLSWKMTVQHWWQVFGLLVLVALINIGGTLLCCVGLLFSAPIGIGAMMYAYEDIFGRRTG